MKEKRERRGAVKIKKYDETEFANMIHRINTLNVLMGSLISRKH